MKILLPILVLFSATSFANNDYNPDDYRLPNPDINYDINGDKIDRLIHDSAYDGNSLEQEIVRAEESLQSSIAAYNRDIFRFVNYDLQDVKSGAIYLANLNKQLLDQSVQRYLDAAASVGYAGIGIKSALYLYGRHPAFDSFGPLYQNVMDAEASYVAAVQRANYWETVQYNIYAPAPF